MKKTSFKTLLSCLILSVCAKSQASWTDEEFLGLHKANISSAISTNWHQTTVNTSTTLITQVATDQATSINLTKFNELKSLIYPGAQTVEEAINKTQQLCKSNESLADSIQTLINKHTSSLQKIEMLKQKLDNIYEVLGEDPEELKKKINPSTAIATVNDAIVSVQNLLKSNKSLHEGVQSLTFEHENSLQEIREAISLLHKDAPNLKTAVSNVMTLFGNFKGEDLSTKIKTAINVIYYANETLYDAVNTIHSLIRPSENQSTFITDIMNLSAKIVLKLELLKGRKDISFPDSIPLFPTAEAAIEFFIKKVEQQI